MMIDMAGFEMMLLMNMPVEHGHFRMLQKNFDGLHAVASPPIPLGMEFEQRPVRQHNNLGVDILFLNVRFQPLNLTVPQPAFGV